MRFSRKNAVVFALSLEIPEKNAEIVCFSAYFQLVKRSFLRKT